MEICLDEYMELHEVQKASIKKTVHKPLYVRGRSFYGKSYIYTMPNGNEVLVSYTTPVVVWDKESDMVIKLQKNDKYTCSSTTMRHINSFLYWHNKKGMSVGKWRKITMI